MSAFGNTLEAFDLALPMTGLLVVSELTITGALGSRILAREQEIDRAWLALADACIAQEELVAALTPDPFDWEDDVFVSIDGDPVSRA